MLKPGNGTSFRNFSRMDYIFDKFRCKFMGQVFDPPGGFESKSSLEPNSGAQNLYELIWPQSVVMSEATAHNHIKCEHTTLHKSWQGYSVPPGTHFNVYNTKT